MDVFRVRLPRACWERCGSTPEVHAQHHTTLREKAEEERDAHAQEKERQSETREELETRLQQHRRLPSGPWAEECDRRRAKKRYTM